MNPAWSPALQAGNPDELVANELLRKSQPTPGICLLLLPYSYFIDILFWVCRPH